jgi:hypothetical protein
MLKWFLDWFYGVEEVKKQENIVTNEVPMWYTPALRSPKQIKPSYSDIVKKHEKCFASNAIYSKK